MGLGVLVHQPGLVAYFVNLWLTLKLKSEPIQPVKHPRIAGVFRFQCQSSSLNANEALGMSMCKSNVE